MPIRHCGTVGILRTSVGVRSTSGGGLRLQSRVPPMTHPRASRTDSDSLRQLLARADGTAEQPSVPAAISERSALAGLMASTELRGIWHAAGWRDALAAIMDCRTCLLRSFALGLGLSLALGLALLAANRPHTPARSVAAAEPAPTNAATAHSPQAVLQPHIATAESAQLPARPRPQMTVAGVIEATVGEAVPFPIAVSEVDADAILRISDLPLYAALSTGVPDSAGAWLVPVSAAKQLTLTSYVLQEAPARARIELIAAHGAPLVSMTTAVTVRAAAPMPLVVPQHAPRSLVVERPLSTVLPKAPTGTVAGVTMVMPPLKRASKHAAKSAGSRIRSDTARKEASNPPRPKPPAREPVLAAATPQQAPELIPPSVMERGGLPWASTWMRSSLGMTYGGQ